MAEINRSKLAGGKCKKCAAEFLRDIIGNRDNGNEENFITNYNIGRDDKIPTIRPQLQRKNYAIFTDGKHPCRRHI